MSIEVELVLGPLGNQIRKVAEATETLSFVLAPDANGRCETVTYAHFGRGLIGPRYVAVGELA